jgi:hypothetical protein
MGTFAGGYSSRPQKQRGSNGSRSIPSDTPAQACSSKPAATVKQVSAWLGHADPAFTLRTYVHLMDEGIGDAAFMDDVLPPARRELAAHR